MLQRTVIPTIARTIRTPRANLFTSKLHLPKLHLRTMASNLPTTMKGISIAKTGGIEVLEWKTDLPVPQPKADEVLVKNEFIGVNYIDTYFRSGLYPPPHLPFILGREGAGTLVALGAGQHAPEVAAAVGARVAYLSPGAYAEYTAVPSKFVYPLPESISTETAAAALLQGLTAVTLIDEAYHVQKGDWILVHAAAGGMGLWLCQLLRARGAHTIGTASTPEKRALAQKAGAEVVLPYAGELGGDEAFTKKILELTGGEGVAAVFDGVGKDTFDVSLSVVRRKGSLISFGNASGAPAPLEIGRLAGKNARLMRPTLVNFVTTRDEFVFYSRQLWDVIGKGELDVAIHKTYALHDAAQAQTDLQGRGTSGKLLLEV